MRKIINADSNFYEMQEVKDVTNVLISICGKICTAILHHFIIKSVNDIVVIRIHNIMSAELRVYIINKYPENYYVHRLIV